MKNNHKAVINFMFFGNNYPHDFIEQVWKGNQLMIDHLRLKFTHLYRMHTTRAFYIWFMELDHFRKEELLSWIDDNYLAFEHLKQE